jgi:hypothetical protein
VTTFYSYPDYAPREPWPEAACLGATKVMALPTGDHIFRKNTQPHIARAKALCAGCPMLVLCRAWALTEPDPCVGMVAGGMTPVERQRARRERA